MPVVAFIGLGMMGLPMAARLVKAGFETRGADLSPTAREAFSAAGGAAFSAAGGAAFADACEAVAGAGVVITMLPDGKIVREVLLGLAADLPSGTLIIDMSSSAPLGTVKLGEELAAKGLRFIDAPVSGGVRRAVNGTLAIMAGGPQADVETARPVLEAMGQSLFGTGPLGSGHAMKALNNYVSAAGLVAAAEAIIVAKRFGLDPNVAVDVLNASTGKNNSTEVKMKQFIISESFGSGFSLALMAKDLRTAAELADQLDLPIPAIQSTADLWDKANAALERGADHTEIYRFLAQISADKS
ncbi:NAD(P)-dependent oxidoreductase [Xanthobacter sp. DSM 24535]|uniref:NAD(P)-dependent oxidoreductase n=1 Tax=Roseixanthobacter psychrophilus TaxID=3119917 RepID=UPI00372C1705